MVGWYRVISQRVPMCVTSNIDEPDSFPPRTAPTAISLSLSLSLSLPLSLSASSGAWAQWRSLGPRRWRSGTSGARAWELGHGGVGAQRAQRPGLPQLAST
jgi:hypothetical protein